MKPALALRHVHFEDLGTLEPLLVERGYRVEYSDMGADCGMGSRTGGDPKPDSADLLIVLGAPVGAFDEELYPFLTEELQWIERRLHAGRPLLGVCLGAQLMARVLGASVTPMGHKEIGFSPVELTAAGRDSALAGLADGSPVLHWHGDQFAIPPGIENLARTNLCPNQAFAVGDHALGLQFHLEANAGKLEPWLIGHAAELSAAGVSPGVLREQAREHGERLKAAAGEVFGKWLDRFE